MSEHEGFDLVAVGDISLGDSPQIVGAGVHAAFEREADRRPLFPFEHVAPMFADAALVFGNLETVTSHAGMKRWSTSSMEMRGHPAAAERLARAGFTVLSVANNHIMQHGHRAFDETVQRLRNTGIAVAGMAGANHRECIPAVLQVGGLTVTILGFAFEEDKYCRGPVAYAFGPDCDIASEIRKAKAQSDVVVCSVHWGLEFVRHPSPNEERLGREMIDSGADLVLGHHPHVVRRLEQYNQGLIAYSLGNFVFDMHWDGSLRVGQALRVRFTRSGLVDYRSEVLWIDDDCQPMSLPSSRSAEAAAIHELQHRPAWASDETTYACEYDRLVSINRRQSHRYFVRHASRRPLHYTIQTLARTAVRKAVSKFQP